MRTARIAGKDYILPRRWDGSKMQPFDKRIPKFDYGSRKELMQMPIDIRQPIKKTEPFKSGRCQKCGDHDDRLYPYLGKVCQKCVNKHIENGGMPIAIIEAKLLFQAKCLTCYNTKGIFYTVNFRACQKCSGKIKRIDKRQSTLEFEKESERRAKRMDKKMEKEYNQL